KSEVVMRKTKVIATLGPATATAEMIDALVSAGADVLRINCSHITTADLRERIALIRATRSDVGVLVDIQGPKLRYAGDPRELREGETERFGFVELGLPEARGGAVGGLATGQRLLMDDGRLEAVIEVIASDHLVARVVRGGLLRTKKGVNLPDTEVGGSVLSDKDRADLEVVKRENVEIVAVSFVQRPSDIDEVRGIIGPTAQVFAKIERPQALERIDDICRVSDGVMAARGDLGVELPFQIVPAAQHKIARTALRHGVTSICATEMLESMITSTRATRAEVADVTGAVRDGFDAVMLSGETAVGAHPLRAVEVMAAICEAAERDVTLPVVFADANPETAAVTAAASSLARRIGADCLLSLTYTGYSARLLAACRPGAAIIAATPTETAARKLKVAWGVYPVVSARDPDVEVSIGNALAVARNKGYVQSGHRVVVCASRLSPRSDADTIWLHTEP
ncbi:MAG: pyruvate kinase, partial [Acidimicrobiia bacterium]|nr:pyruvate kinase [Acidimicrobiia bacterium]